MLKKLIVMSTLLVAALIMHPVLALAAEAAPETVAQASSETTKFIWGWGSAVSSLADIIAPLVLAVATFALRKLPANLVAMFGNARVDKLIENAIGWGINSVKGATRDKVLEVDVGNKVLANALQYAVDNASPWLLSWGGGAENIGKKIVARLKLNEDAEISVDAALAKVS